MEDDEFAELLRSLRGGPSTGTSWDDVRAEVRRLGDTIGDVLRAAWQHPDNQASVRFLQGSLQALGTELSSVFEATPETQQARAQLVRLRDELRSSAERATDELRPELVSALRQVNAELRRLSRLDAGSDGSETERERESDS